MGDEQQHAGHRDDHLEAQPEVAGRARHPAQEEQGHEQRQQSHAPRFPDDGGRGPGAVAVQDLAELDADVRDHARHVRRADRPRPDAGDQGVLQAHGEAQHGHHDQRPVRIADVLGEQAEHQHADALEQEDVGVARAEAVDPAPVEHQRADDRAQDEHGQREQARADQTRGVEDRRVRHGRHDPRHVGRVRGHGDEAHGVEDPRDRGQHQRQVGVATHGALGGAQVEHPATLRPDAAVGADAGGAVVDASRHRARAQ